jgi:ABC-type lipoprotein release transport system permease subunit
LDKGLCLLPIGVVRDLLRYGADECTHVSIFLSDSRRSTAVKRRLNERLDPQAVALTWDEVQPELSGFIAMKVGGARLMEIIIAILVAAGIFNTLFVSVMERMREFGIMIAIGYAPGQLFRLVMWESFWLAMVGLLACGLLTLGPYIYLVRTGLDYGAMVGGEAIEIAGIGWDPVIRVGIFPEHLLVILAAMVLATLVAGLYPALKAGRVEPVDSIRLV